MRTDGIARVALIAAFVTIAFPSFAQTWATRPNPSLTPGRDRDLTLTQICATKWGSDVRAVSESMKQSVMDAYRFRVSTCPFTVRKGKRMHRVEIDHLIPRSIGGAD